MGNFADILRSGLQGAIDIKLEKERAEIESERYEGPAEFANPQTVSQPVHQSQFPGGQPRNLSQFNIMEFFANNQLALLIGFSVLLMIFLFLKFAR